ncbi:MAG: putative DNA binding domain-containing protein [bacterium]
MNIHNENNRIEYKAILTKDIDLEKEVIAFLNYNEGGYIYIGIDKYGNTVGVKDIDGDMLKIKDRIKHNISPSAMGLFDISEETIDDKKVIKITVASGSEKPYFKTKYGMTTKSTYIRVGTAAEPMTQNTIDNLFSRRVRNSIGRIVSNRQDLTFSQLLIYYQGKNRDLGDNFAKSLELLVDNDKYNYAAYLLADENNNSIKIAKFSSLDRSNLIENNEYGYCSLIKATQNVLSKMEVENSTAAYITYPNRIEAPKWDKKALREALINAIVHNDYSFEVPPKFEIFPDRLEITSAGKLPDDIDEEEFFNGISSPRNKELMRVFRDVELVESLGYGVPKIVKKYGKQCFKFMTNFTRMVLPISKEYLSIINQERINAKTTPQDGSKITPQDTPQDEAKSGVITPQDETLIEVIEGEMSQEELRIILGFTDKKYFKDNYIATALKSGIIEQTTPDETTSKNQNYRLGTAGLAIKKYLENNEYKPTPQDGSKCTPQVNVKITPQDEIITPPIKALIEVIDGEMSQEELRTILGFTDRKHFRDKYIITALKSKIIKLTIPDKPTSRNQKYRLTILGKNIKKYLKNIGHITTPQDGSKFTPQDNTKFTPQVKALIEVIEGEMNQEELRTILGFTDRKYFRNNYITPALKLSIIELTIPDKPTSKNQKYRLTALGLKIKR